MKLPLFCIVAGIALLLLSVQLREEQVKIAGNKGTTSVIGGAIGLAGGAGLGATIGGIGIVLCGTGVGIPVGGVMCILGVLCGGAGAVAGSALGTADKIVPMYSPIVWGGLMIVSLSMIVMGLWHLCSKKKK